MLKLLADGRILLLQGVLSNAGVYQGHGEGAVAQEGGDALQGHVPVDGQGSQGMAQAVRCDPGWIPAALAMRCTASSTLPCPMRRPYWVKRKSIGCRGG